MAYAVAVPSPWESAALTTLLSGSVVLSGTSVASALQKSQAQQAPNGCGGGADLWPADFASSPTQMQLGSDVAVNVRGLVVGNLLVWLACAAAGAMAPLLMQLRRQQGKWAVRLAVLAGLVALPGKLVLPYSIGCAERDWGDTAAGAGCERRPGLALLSCVHLGARGGSGADSGEVSRFGKTDAACGVRVAFSSVSAALRAPGGVGGPEPAAQQRWICRMLGAAVQDVPATFAMVSGCRA